MSQPNAALIVLMASRGCADKGPDKERKRMVKRRRWNWRREKRKGREEEADDESKKTRRRLRRRRIARMRNIRGME